MANLETIEEVLGRIEKKVDKINGSVVEQNKRIFELEKDTEVHKAEIRIITRMFKTVGAPLLVGVMLSFIKIFFFSQ